MEWKDTTSYAQGERGKVAPRTYTCQLGTEIRIIITKKHLRHQEYTPFGWCLRLSGAEVVRWSELHEENAEAAQRKAMKAAYGYLHKLHKQIAESMGEIDDN